MYKNKIRRSQKETKTFESLLFSVDIGFGGPAITARRVLGSKVGHQFSMVWSSDVDVELFLTGS